MPNTKGQLKALLAEASELGTRRRARFDRADAIQRLAELIDDYSPLLALTAFRAFYVRIFVDGLEATGITRPRADPGMRAPASTAADDLNDGR